MPNCRVDLHAAHHVDHDHDYSTDTDNSASSCSRKRRRPPVIRIVRLFAPRVFTAEPADFRTLVQKLTGREESTAHQSESAPVDRHINLQISDSTPTESAPADRHINLQISDSTPTESAPADESHQQYSSCTQSTIAVDADAVHYIDNIKDHSYPIDDDIIDHLYDPIDKKQQYTCSKAKKLRVDDDWRHPRNPKQLSVPATEDDHYNDTDEYVSSTLIPSLLPALSTRRSPSPGSNLCSSSSASPSPSHPVIDPDLTILGAELPALEAESAMAPSQLSSAAGAASCTFSSLHLISSFLMSSPTTPLSPEFPDFPLLYASSLLPAPTDAPL